MNCPRCNSINPHTAAFCLNCGYRFEVQPPPFATAYAPPPPVFKTGMAVASLVLGIISIVTFGLFGVGAITGLILGIVALSNAKNHPMTYGGKGSAIAGIVTNGFALVLTVVMVVGFVMAFRQINRERTTSDEYLAISNIRALEQAEYSYFLTNNHYGTLNQLIEANEINSSWSAPSKSGYKFRVVVSRAYYEIFANPEKYGSTGKNSFYAKSVSGTDPANIHQADKSGFDANEHDPTLAGISPGGVPGGIPAPPPPVKGSAKYPPPPPAAKIDR